MVADNTRQQTLKTNSHIWLKWSRCYILDKEANKKSMHQWKWKDKCKLKQFLLHHTFFSLAYSIMSSSIIYINRNHNQQQAASNLNQVRKTFAKGSNSNNSAVIHFMSLGFGFLFWFFQCLVVKFIQTFQNLKVCINWAVACLTDRLLMTQAVGCSCELSAT